MVYPTHFPDRSLQTARNAKTSPLHPRLAEQGAHFKDVSGWEGADWYAGRGQTAEPGPLTWGRPTYWKLWEEEHCACREGVIVMDMSFMSKFRVQGRQAGQLLDSMSGNSVNGSVGEITYTQWLNERGTLEADLTVTKLPSSTDDGDDFLVVASDTAHRHVESQMRRHFGDAHAIVTDVTGGYAQINVQGPKSRELLQLLTTADMSNAAFPFRAAREIDIGFARVLCIRITYLGELGYELYVASEQAVHVYDRLIAAGAAFDLRHAGLKALASLRMEKGYRDYGHDIDNTDGPLEAGFGFALALDKPGGFIGRDAIVKRKAAGPLTERLVQVQVLDPEPLMFHAEVLRRDDRPVGYLRAASYGHTLGGAVGLAMVKADGAAITPEWLTSGTWTVEIVNRQYPVAVSLRPFYDPSNARIKL